MNEFNGILEDVTEANLKQLVEKIMILATQRNYYEFVPGFFLIDNEYLIEYQKRYPDNHLVKNKDFTKAPFYVMQTEAIIPCNDPLKIAGIILMTEGMGSETEY